MILRHFGDPFCNFNIALLKADYLFSLPFYFDNCINLKIFYQNDNNIKMNFYICGKIF